MVNARNPQRARTTVGTRAMVTGVFASVGVVLIGWQFAAAALTPGDTSASVTSTGSLSGTTSDTTQSSSDAAASGAEATSGSTSTSGTFTGTTVSTRFGPVQVAVTVSDGVISDVTALQLTDQGSRSVQITACAVPILRSEVLQSQSAQVSMVSGATYTSEAYLTSLQSALDQIGN